MKKTDDTEKKKNEPIAKVMFEEKIVCPHCKKKIITRKTRKMMQKAVPAVWEEKVMAIKDSQKTLQESSGPKLDQKKKNK